MLGREQISGKIHFFIKMFRTIQEICIFWERLEVLFFEQKNPDHKICFHRVEKNLKIFENIFFRIYFVNGFKVILFINPNNITRLSARMLYDEHTRFVVD